MRHRNPHYAIVGVAFMLAALTALTSTDILAQPGSRGMGGRGGMPPGLRALDLTDEQRDQMRSVREQYQNAALAEQLRAARRALDDAITAGVVNESEIRGLAAQLAPLEADAAVQRAYRTAAILEVLTPTQREELRQVQADNRERVRDRLRRRSQP